SRPGLCARDHADEIGAEDRGDDDRGVTRVREVVHAPRPGLADSHIGGQGARHAPRLTEWAGIWHGPFLRFRYSFGSMQQALKTGTTEARLTLAEVLDWLVGDGLAVREAAEALRKERRY